MLDLLITAKNEERVIDDEGIREEVDTFMFEGHDTTAVALDFALMMIACHKQVQDQIYEEIKSVLGDARAKPTYNDLQEMKYLERALKEVLRLYPSVHFISRNLGDDVVTASGYELPKNTLVHLHIYDLHHNPDIYPDPERFDPDRFLPENCQNRHPFAYLPFSAGSRNCIGQRFAMLELKAAICGILAHFVLEPVDTPSTIVLVVDLILRTKDPIRVNILQQFDNIFNEETDRHVDIFKEIDDQSCVPINPPITQLKLKTIAVEESAMGTNLQFNTEEEMSYKRAVFTIGDVLLYRLIHTWLIYKLVNFFSPKFFEEKKALKVLNNFTKRTANGGSQGVHEEVDTFMFEGHDTIFQEQIVEEMGLVLGNAPQKPTYKDLQEMKYLKRVVKEVLRLTKEGIKSKFVPRE
uniref:Cytochrome P450 monooxygenase n=1 Tax=Tenebrio molitor TaxID=7067 RepID=A0A8J6H3B0_TENMO|nr:hypothetical protein GEV33_015570 [Tenebrio molitor]